MSRPGLIIPVAAWVLAVAASPVGAQRRRSVPIQPLGILDYGGSLYAEGEMNTDNQESASFTTEEEDWIFEEGIELNSKGYVYHTNLLEWYLGVRLGVTQERVRVNERQFRTSGTLLGYDFSGLILKEKPVSFRVFADRNEDRRDRDFARSAKVRQQREGLSILTRGSFPLTVLFERLRREEESDLRAVSRRTNHLRLSMADRRNPDWLTEFVYDREETDETSRFISGGGGAETAQDLPDLRDEVSVTNVWKFGKGDRKHSLAGHLRAVDRRGFFNNRILVADQRLDLVHTPSFSTFYVGVFDLDETDVESDRRMSGEIGFLKKFYESLDLTGRAIVTDRSFLNGSEQSAGGSLHAAYRKKTPIGRYTSSLLLGRQRLRQESTTGRRSFRDEAVTLSGISFSRLKNPNIQAGSIVVTNSAHTITYVEGDDYVLQTIGAFTEIARVADGEITDGQVVLVGYTAPAARNAVFLTDQINWSHRLRARKLPISLYADYRLRDETLQSGDDPGNLDRQRTFLAGVEMDYRNLVVTLEHEIRDRELSPPSVASRARVRYRRSLGRNVDLSLSAHAERLRHKRAEEFGLEEGADFLDTVGANAHLTAKLTRRALVRFQSDFLQTRGRENRMLFRNGVSLEWQRGKLDFSIDARYDVFEQEQTRGDAASIMFKIKRDF